MLTAFWEWLVGPYRRLQRRRVIAKYRQREAERTLLLLRNKRRIKLAIRTESRPEQFFIRSIRPEPLPDMRE